MDVRDGREDVSDFCMVKHLMSSELFSSVLKHNELLQER